MMQEMELCNGKRFFSPLYVMENGSNRLYWSGVHILLDSAIGILRIETN